MQCWYLKTNMIGLPENLYRPTWKKNPGEIQRAYSQYQAEPRELIKSFYIFSTTDIPTEP
jgi:hypothetical protein